MPVRFKSLFWVWFNATSAAAVRGETSISGGQVHIALGRSGDEVRAFLRGLNIRQVNKRWQLPLEPFGTLPAFNLPLAENPASNQRIRECRIPGQSPRSRQVYPLWQTTVELIEGGTLPQQVLLLLRDQSDKLHARVLNAKELNRLPPKIAAAVFENRNQNLHTLNRSGILHDAAVSASQSKSAGQTKRPAVARPQNPTQSAPDWDTLAAYVRQVEGKQRVTRVAPLERKLRDNAVRSQALKCFGARCQVQECTCTAGLPDAWLRYVLEVHHLKAVAKGGSDSLFNLSVLCANHHRLFERLPNLQALTEPDSDDVLLLTDNEGFLIERDLKLLRQALSASV